MPLITVTGGGPDVDPGVYTLVCTAVDGPKAITPQRGPNAGQTINVFDWRFEIMDGDWAGTELRGTTSAMSGPRSKMYAWLTALLGGTPPDEGTEFEADDLTGRVCLGTVSKDEAGWPRIDQLSALPLAYQQQAQASRVMGQQAAAQYPPQQAQAAPPRQAPPAPAQAAPGRPPRANRQAAPQQPAQPRGDGMPWGG